MSNARTRLPNKSSLAVRHILDERGIDLVNLQIAVYTKAMDAFDRMRGLGEKGDSGPGYLSVCNQAIGTLAKYAYPTMSAIKLEDLNNSVNDKVIDAVTIRQRILNDPFAKNVVVASEVVSIGLPVLPLPEVKTNES